MFEISNKCSNRSFVNRIVTLLKHTHTHITTPYSHTIIVLHVLGRQNLPKHNNCSTDGVFGYFINITTAQISVRPVQCSTYTSI